jgi:hypothetical protein
MPGRWVSGLYVDFWSSISVIKSRRIAISSERRVSMFDRHYWDQSARGICLYTSLLLASEKGSVFVHQYWPSRTRSRSSEFRSEFPSLPNLILSYYSASLQ